MCYKNINKRVNFPQGKNIELFVKITSIRQYYDTMKLSIVVENASFQSVMIHNYQFQFFFHLVRISFCYLCICVDYVLRVANLNNFFCFQQVIVAESVYYLTFIHFFFVYTYIQDYYFVYFCFIQKILLLFHYFIQTLKF